ncbi:type III secretion system inner membrane ring lipoprotein SctJ [Thiofilum flexile]|uniref:type III secretion system inner membrane ring lipoprotein SctJ n=1 Tax=Thiofilum flexile TaxID=125627 RepID=UPI000368DAEE|nr:type III secretion inner membrane ring lipoprotein SctJ [Thiofilum flexile]
MNIITIRLKTKLALLLSIFLLAGCKVQLHSQLNEIDANNMMAILLENDIGAEKIADLKNGTYTLNVDDSKIPQAVALLREHGYPREKVASMQELFKKDGLISSPLEERARYIYALSQSVQETLSQIDGVLVARVHVVLPEDATVTNNNPVTPSSASVFIKYHPSFELESMKSEIKLIVEKSIQGLSYDKVSVVMVPAQLPNTSK